MKYNSLISDREKGGIKLPDFETRITSQQIMWVKRLLAKSSKLWKIIPTYYLAEVGGVSCIGSNFDHKVIPKHLPSFYVSALNAWSKFVHTDPKTKDEIVLQPLWNNCKIKGTQTYIENCQAII